MRLSHVVPPQNPKNQRNRGKISMKMIEISITASEVLEALDRGETRLFSMFQGPYVWPQEMRDGDTLKVTEDYGVKAVNTGGTGNSGDCIIVGISKAGRATVRNLKNLALQKQGISQKTAEKAVRMAYGMELSVAQTADVLSKIPLSTPPKSHREWRYKFGEVGDGLSFPRKLAAFAIAAA